MKKEEAHPQILRLIRGQELTAQYSKSCRTPGTVKIRVLVVDEQAMIREGITALLSNQSDIEVVGEAEDGREAYNKVIELHPEVVLMESVLPVEDGIESSRRILRDYVDTKIVILSQYADGVSVRTAVQAGVSGYLPKTAGIEDILQSIRAVYQGGCYFHSDVTRTLIEEYRRLTKYELSQGGDGTLTPSETRILKFVGGGYTSIEISKMLNVSLRTVNGHRTHMMHKLGVRNSVDLIKFAVRKGIVKV